jgi:phosphohistidine phosphatase
VTDARRLLVMRHAKAEPFAASDHGRGLTERGRASAHDVGRYLRQQGVVPEYVVVSSALRTRQTWEAVAQELGDIEAEVNVDDALFSGGPDVVVDALHGTPPDARTVMFVGHNPTAAYLCHYLDDGEGDEAAVSGLLKGFPPSAVAELEVGVAWSDLGAESARVVGFYVGQG